tara:strand:+ start:1330 stop:1596 length:267 start_codon:yes stop_codon:yes gene_type:complete
MLKTKLIDNNFKKTIKVEDMLPMQIGIVCDNVANLYNGDIVMRTQSQKKFEVMNLSNPEIDGCWSGSVSGFSVKLLGRNHTITLTQTE